MKKVVFGAILIIFAIVIVGCIMYEPDLEFQAKAYPCGQEAEGIKSYDWPDNSTLIITVYATADCAEEIINGSCKITGKNITLEYKTSGCDNCTMETCCYELTYKLSGINRNNYDIYLEEIG